MSFSGECVGRNRTGDAVEHLLGAITVEDLPHFAFPTAKPADELLGTCDAREETGRNPPLLNALTSILEGRRGIPPAELMQTPLEKSSSLDGDADELPDGPDTPRVMQTRAFLEIEEGNDLLLPTVFALDFATGTLFGVEEQASLIDSLVEVAEPTIVRNETGR